MKQVELMLVMSSLVALGACSRWAACNELKHKFDIHQHLEWVKMTDTKLIQKKTGMDYNTSLII